MRVDSLTPDAAPNRKLPPYGRLRALGAREKRVFVHAIFPAPCGRGWTCWVCAKSSLLKANLLKQRCCANANVASHSLWKVGRFTFCSKCGARHSERVRLLKKECSGSPSSASTARNLRLLKEGRDPVSAGSPFLGRPVPDMSLLALLRGGRAAPPSASSSAPPAPREPNEAVDALIRSALPTVNVVFQHDDGEAEDMCVWEVKE